jgi:hypothetical protein
VNRTSLLRGLLVTALLAVPFIAIADHHSGDGAPKSDANEQHHRFNPVEKAEKHLKTLEQKLNLQAEQQAAWKGYSTKVLARASERAAHMKEFHSKRKEHHASMDTATFLEHMSQRMREKADKMEQMARDTRTFQQVLSPEQQAIFDKYWKSQFGHKKKGHRRDK